MSEAVHLYMRLGRKGERIGTAEKEVKGVIFTLEKYKLTLDDGSEVILSIGTPKKEQNKAKTHP
jgi:hypothetical protein